MEITLMIFLGIASFLMGVVVLLGYMVYRMVGSSGWDDSNITNALRLISHVVMHPEDFPKMFYLKPADLELLAQYGFKPKQPFWYLSKDEFSEVVKTRPKN